jgi:hypothetical protein
MNNRIAEAFDKMKYVKVAACYALWQPVVTGPFSSYHPSSGSPPCLAAARPVV